MQKQRFLQNVRARSCHNWHVKILKIQRYVKLPFLFWPTLPQFLKRSKQSFMPNARPNRSHNWCVRIWKIHTNVKLPLQPSTSISKSSKHAFGLNILAKIRYFFPDLVHISSTLLVLNNRNPYFSLVFRIFLSLSYPWGIFYPCKRHSVSTGNK